MSDKPKKEIVKLHQAMVEELKNPVYYDGLIYEIDEDRKVEVWKIKESDGLCLRFFAPTKDGKISKLSFGLTLVAAQALLDALHRQLITGK